MTWRKQTMCIILLMVARILADGDSTIVQDIRHLSNRISAGSVE